MGQTWDTATRQPRRPLDDLTDRIHRGRLIVLAVTGLVLATILAALAALTTPAQIRGDAAPSMVTVTLTGRYAIHPEPGGRCTVGTTAAHWGIRLVSPSGAAHAVRFDGGILDPDTRMCRFTVAVAALPGADHIVLSTHYGHDVPAGTKNVTVSITDGQWYWAGPHEP